MTRRGFRRTRDGLKLRLQPLELEILAELLEQLETLVAPLPGEHPQDPLAAAVGIAAVAQRPQDPALLRLLPDAYLDDPAAADDFRRYTEVDLRRQKAENAAGARQSLAGAHDPTLTMTRAQGQVWLLALNDLRLAMAVRLGIADEAASDAAVAQESPPEIYDWLTWLQSTLVDALMH